MTLERRVAALERTLGEASECSECRVPLFHDERVTAAQYLAGWRPPIQTCPTCGNERLVIVEVIVTTREEADALKAIHAAEEAGTA